MTPARPWVAYMGPFLFPEGEAASRRVLGMAQAIAFGDRDVVVCSGSAPAALPADVLGHERIRHVGLGDRPASLRRNPLRGMAQIARWGTRAVRWLDAQESRPSHVVVYGGYGIYSQRVYRWCSQHGIPVVQDIVEWYAPDQFVGGRLNPLWLTSEWGLRQLYPRADGLICITRWLAKHYSAVHEHLLVVPPLAIPLDEPSPRTSPAMTLAYAGAPGTKEDLALVAHEVIARADAGEQIEIVLAGPDRDWQEQQGIPEHPSVRVLGRVPGQDARRLVREADFTVLPRRHSRTTAAGFPSKLVESLALGTPVIANLTSDLATYLVDGRNALLVEDSTARGWASVLERALRLTPHERQELSRGALRTVDHALSPRAFAPPMEAFMTSLERTLR